MFFSRRIGLSDGQAVPVIAGGRVTGKAGPFDVGALAITTDDKPSAGAVDHDVLGAAAAAQHPAAQQRRHDCHRPLAGRVGQRRQCGPAGVDADLRFFDNVEANLYWARTSSPGSARRRRQLSRAVRLRRRPLRLRRRPRRRPGELQSRGRVRPANRLRDERVSVCGSARGCERGRHPAAVVEREPRVHLRRRAETCSRIARQSGQFGIEFNSSDEVNVSAERNYERLPADFTISPGVVVPAGGYSTRHPQRELQPGAAAESVGDGLVRRTDRSTAARGRRPATAAASPFRRTSASSRTSR